jgi:hypothetical protein
LASAVPPNSGTISSAASDSSAIRLSFLKFLLL